MITMYAKPVDELYKYIYISDAAKDLNGAAFKLWTYLYCCGQGITFDFRMSSFTKDFGGSRSTAQRGFNELKEKGYLEEIKEHENFYFFHIDPNWVSNTEKI